MYSYPPTPRAVVARALGASEDQASVPVAATIGGLLAGLLKESHAVGAMAVAEQVCPVGAGDALVIRETVRGFFFDDRGERVSGDRRAHV